MSHYANTNGIAHGDDDSSGSPDSTTLSIETISTAEIPQYFVERNGRIFSSRDIPYPLPVDSTEVERLNTQHELIKLLVGQSWFGPLAEVLAHVPGGRQKRVLDVFCGTGIWVEEVAALFPHAKFIGVDVVPISSTLQNVQFECDDVLHAGLRYRDGSIDVVHLRDVALGVPDYPALLKEVSRVLRPGGLILCGEWDHTNSMVDGSGIAQHAPATYNFWNTVQAALIRGGISQAGPFIPHWFVNNGSFERVSPATFYVPVHRSAPEPYTELGRIAGSLAFSFAGALRPLLIRTITSEAEVDDMIEKYGQELETLRMIATYRAIFAYRS